MKKEERIFAVRTTTGDDYHSLGSKLREAIRKQAETMLQASVDSAVRSCAYQLFDRTGEDRWASDDFGAALNKLIGETLAAECQLVDPDITKILTKKDNLEKRLEQLRQSAMNVMRILEQVKIEGAAPQIQLIMEFVQEVEKGDNFSI